MHLACQPASPENALIHGRLPASLRDFRTQTGTIATAFAPQRALASKDVSLSRPRYGAHLQAENRGFGARLSRQKRTLLAPAHMTVVEVGASAYLCRLLTCSA